MKKSANMKKTVVGSYNKEYDREKLENSARKLGLGREFIKELSDSELNLVVLNESCRQNEKGE